MKSGTLKGYLTRVDDRTDLPTPEMLAAGGKSIHFKRFMLSQEDTDLALTVREARLKALRQEGKPVGAASRGDSPRDAAPTDTPAEGWAMGDEAQTCKTCGELKDMSAFVKSKAFTNGYSPSCIECRQKGRPKAPALLGSEIAVLRLLRNHAGMLRAEIERRIGYGPVARIPKLAARGLVESDAEGYIALTAKGRELAPYRNRHLEAKRLQAVGRAGASPLPTGHPTQEASHGHA